MKRLKEDGKIELYHIDGNNNLCIRSKNQDDKLMTIFDDIRRYTLRIDKIANKIQPVFPKSHGSGVLVSHEGKGFLFLAGHVFTNEDISKLGVTLPAGFTPFMGHVTFMSTNKDKSNPNNRADVAIYSLDEQCTRI